MTQKMRFRWQFSLRSCLVLVSCSGPVSLGLAAYIEVAVVEWNSAQSLRELGYVQVHSDFLDRYGFHPPKRPASKVTWTERLLSRPVGVHVMSNSHSRDKELLRHIRQLDGMRKLSVCGLSLSDTALVYLCGAARLQDVAITDRTVPRLALNQLTCQRSLRRLTIARCDLADDKLTQLVRLGQLEQLNLESTGMSEQTLRVLERSLQNTTIYPTRSERMSDDRLTAPPADHWAWLRAGWPRRLTSPQGELALSF